MQHEQHECYINDASATQVKYFDYDKSEKSDKSENVFVLLSIGYMAKDYKERNNFILRTNFWKCIVPTRKCV